MLVRYRFLKLEVVRIPNACKMDRHIPHSLLKMLKEGSRTPNNVLVTGCKVPGLGHIGTLRKSWVTAVVTPRDIW